MLCCLIFRLFFSVPRSLSQTPYESEFLSLLLLLLFRGAKVDQKTNKKHIKLSSKISS